jgi:Transposase DDE domain
LTKASGSDNHEAVVGLQLLAGEDAPVRVLGDSAYGTGDTRAALAAASHVAVIKPLPQRTPVPGGFTSDDFTIDFDARTVTCPADHTVTIRPSGSAAFERYCRSCPLASRCTTATRGRKLTFSKHEQLLRAARALAKDPDWQSEYRQHRPMVERSIAWLTRNNRKVRYRGIAKNDHWLHHRVAALNLRRLITMGLTHTGTSWAIA